MLQRCLVAAALLALLLGCSGREEPGEPQELAEAQSGQEVAEAQPGPEVAALADKPRLSGIERKRMREAQAEFGKGFSLLFGRGVARDPVQGHAHLLKAAELGHARSQGLVGVNYQKGRGTKADQAEAIRWLKLGAEGGWPHAQLKLGEAYRDGRGVEQDPVEALKWLALSGRGSIAGKMIASSYVASLSPAQRQEGLTRARDWRIAHGLPVKQMPEDAAGAQAVVERVGSKGGTPDAAQGSKDPGQPTPDAAQGSKDPAQPVPDAAQGSKDPAQPVPDAAQGSKDPAQPTPDAAPTAELDPRPDEKQL